jgi:hypothetical protein
LQAYPGGVLEAALNRVVPDEVGARAEDSDPVNEGVRERDLLAADRARPDLVTLDGRAPRELPQVYAVAGHVRHAVPGDPHLHGVFVRAHAEDEDAVGALDLDPNSEDGLYMYTVYSIQTGRTDESFAYASRYEEVNGGNPPGISGPSPTSTRASSTRPLSDT